MPVEIPKLPKLILDEYITAINKDLPGLVRACYIHGSIALNDFQPPFSDIDFITVTNRRCNENDIQQLKVIHQRLKRQFPRASNVR